MKGTAASIQREEAEQTDETSTWRLMHVAYVHGFAHCSSTPPLNDKAREESGEHARMQKRWQGRGVEERWKSLEEPRRAVEERWKSVSDTASRLVESFLA
jgi:hypothetical protein